MIFLQMEEDLHRTKRNIWSIRRTANSTYISGIQTQQTLVGGEFSPHCTIFAYKLFFCLLAFQVQFMYMFTNAYNCNYSPFSAGGNAVTFI